MKSINTILKGFFLRQAISPFETMIAFFFMYAAISGLLNFGVTVTPLAKVLGSTLSKALYVIYFIAGFAIYFGIGLSRGDMEGFGLILLIACLMVIIIATGWLLGPHPATINSCILNTAFIFSCTIRLCSLARAQKMLNGQS